jgi:hypothetical protein
MTNCGYSTELHYPKRKSKIFAIHFTIIILQKNLRAKRQKKKDNSVVSPTIRKDMWLKIVESIYKACSKKQGGSGGDIQ